MLFESKKEILKTKKNPVYTGNGKKIKKENMSEKCY